MSEWFTLNASEMDRLQAVMDDYAGNAGPIVDQILHGEGAERIKAKIAMLLPASGRQWRGKAAPARSVMPGRFSQDNGQMSVTIAARGTYHYLYFPDDGSNTRHHAGNQQFMQRGAENAADKVIDLCIGKLTENF